MKNNEELLTIRAVAERLRVDTSTVRRWILGGKLEAIELPQIGNRSTYRVPQSALNRILATPVITPQEIGI